MPAIKEKEATQEKKDEGAEVLSKLSPEELEKQRVVFLHKHGFGPKPIEEPKKDQKPDEPEKGEASEEDEKPEKPEKLEKREKPPRQEKPKPNKGKVDEEFAERFADRLVESVETRLGRKEKAEEPEPEPQEDNSAELEVLEELELTNARYKGIRDATEKFWKKEEKYAQEWKKVNAGQEFDPEGAEHEDFYAKEQPKYEEEDLASARRRVETRRIIKEEIAPTRDMVGKETGRLREEMLMRSEGPALQKIAYDSVTRMLQQSAPDLAKLATNDKGQIVLTEESLKKIEEADPIALEILNEEAEQLRNLVIELEKLWRYPGAYPANDDFAITMANGHTYHPHRDLLGFASRLEKDISELQKDETKKDGKTFMTLQEYTERTEKILKSKMMNPPQKTSALRDMKTRYWLLTSEDIERALVADFSERTQARIKKETDRLENWSKRKPKGATEETPSKTGETEPKQAPVKAQRRFPSTAAGSENVNTQKPGENSGTKRDEVLANKMGW